MPSKSDKNTFTMLSDLQPVSAQTDTRGEYIDLTFSVAHTPLLPATAIDGFTISAPSVNNGNPLAPQSAVVISPTIVRLTLAQALHYSDNTHIAINYTHGSVSFTDSNTVPTQVPNFSNFTTVTVNIDHAAPTFSSAYTDTAGRYVYVVFNDITPPLLPATGNIDGFQVSIDGGSTWAIPTTAIRLGGNGVSALTIQLQVSQRISNGNSVKFKYTPGSIALTDSAPDNNAVVAITSTTVTNNAVDRHVFFGSATTDYSGLHVNVTFTSNISSQILPISGNIPGFVVNDNGSPITVTDARRISPMVVKITLASQMTNGHTITVSYTPGSPAITDDDSPPNALLAFTNQSVTNITSERIAPVFLRANPSIDGSFIDVVFTEANSAPLLPISPRGFTVTQTGVNIPVSSVARVDSSGIYNDVLGLTYRLTLGTLLTHSAILNDIIVTYTQPLNSPIITDSAPIPNKLASFSDGLIYNGSSPYGGYLGLCVADRNAPYISTTNTDVQASSGGTSINVKINVAANNVLNNGSYNVGLIANNNTGWTLKVNGVTRSYSTIQVLNNGQLTSGQATIQISGFSSFTCEDIVTISYNGSNAVTDQAHGGDGNSDPLTHTTLHANSLLAFTNRKVDMSLMSDTIAPTYLSSSVDSDGIHVDAVFHENRSLPLTPSVGINGFYIMVNGIPRTISSAYVKSLNPFLSDSSVVRLKLVDRIYRGDTVKVSYYGHGLTNNLADGAANAVVNFGPNTVTNNALADPIIPFNFFSPLTWIQQTGTNPPRGDLYELRYGFPTAQMILSTTKPQGEVVLNENPQTGGIHVHHFEAYSSHDFEITGTTSGDIALTTPYTAFSLVSNGEETIAQLAIKLKASSTDDSAISLAIYSDASNTPGTLLATSSTRILVSSLTNAYTLQTFDLPFDLGAADTKYWVVLTTSLISGAISVQEFNIATGEYTFTSNTASWTAPFPGKQVYYKLIAATGSGVPISSYDETQNAIGEPVAPAQTYGGAADPNLYEVIGYGEHRSLVKIFSKVDNTNYPSVKSIEVGLTASRGKAYVVEAIPQDGTTWQPIFYMIADQNSVDYINYTFTSEVKLQQIRIRYRGDFYAQDNAGTVTVSNFTSLVPMQAVQLSHYTDFRDATDFPGTDADGWLPFDDGTTTFDWSLLNLALTWNKLDSGSQPILGAIEYVNGFNVFDRYSIYRYDTDNGLVHEVSLVSGTTQINCFAIYHNDLYVGCSDGTVFVSSDGVNFTQTFTNQTLASVTSLTSYRGKLWIGTARDAHGISKLYSYADNTNLFNSEHTFTEGYLSAMCVYGSYLFVGTGGVAGSGLGKIYVFDGTIWALTFNSNSDAVDSLIASSVTSSVWAGVRGGGFWSNPFDSGGKPTAWTSIYVNDSDVCYSITDDPNGLYVWLATDNGLYGYIKSTNSTNLIEAIPVDTNGLSGTWTNATSTNYQTLDAGGTNVFSVDSTINFANLNSSRPVGVNATYYNAHWDGWIKADFTDLYTFQLILNSGARLYIDNTLVIDSWSDKITPATVSGNFAMVANQFYKIRLEFYYAATGTPELVLKWLSAHIPSATVIPNTALFLPSATSQIVYAGSSPYAFSKSGNVYLFDPSFVGNSKRNVYARFKDAVGNITDLPNVPTDEIIQATGSASAALSNGRIYQVKPDKDIAVTYSSGASGALHTPDRILLESGVYESEPFYAPTLTHWNSIISIADLPAGADVSNGLQNGVTVTLYVATAKTRAECLAAEYGSGFATTTINNPSAVGDLVTSTFNIASLDGKWLKFRIVLSSASQGYTPSLHSIEITYQASQASYFFTKMFDTSDYSSLIPAPVWRRFLLTSNTVPNGGSIIWGYTTDESAGNTFDFGKFTPIEDSVDVPLHHIVELEQAEKTIRFGAQLISVMDASTPPYLQDVGAVRLASTQNVNISTIRLSTPIDGILPAEGDRVLLKDQTTKSENGVWIARGSGVWTRPALQYNSHNQMTFVGLVSGNTTGHFCGVTNGNTNKKKSFVVKSIDTPTSGDINIIQFTGAIIDDFAVQLDAGPVDMKLMPSNPY